MCIETHPRRWMTDGPFFVTNAELNQIDAENFHTIKYVALFATVLLPIDF